MKFFSVATAALVVFAGLAAATPRAAEAAEVSPRAPEAAEAASLNARACTPSRCRCNGIQGQFCGTSTINPDCVKGHVYECNPNGSTCDYGIRNSCVQCNRLVC